MALFWISRRELSSIVVQRKQDAGEDGSSRATAVPAPGDMATWVVEAMQVHDEIDRLPRRERQAVVLRVQCQLSVQQTADMMGVSSGAVKRYTADGMRKLRERLTGDGGAHRGFRPAGPDENHPRTVWAP